MSKKGWKKKKTPEQGRQKGSKNLATKDGRLVNKHGVEFTEAEKKALVSKVNSASRKRRKMLDAAGEIEVYKDGKPAGYTLDQKMAMGFESDFILAKKSKSLHQFKTRKSFELYMKNLDRVNSPTYIDERIKQYKSNWLKAFRENIFPHGRDIYYKVMFMKPKDYMLLVEGNEDFEISYIYDPAQLAKKLAAMRAALGMAPKDDEIPIDDEEIE